MNRPVTRMLDCMCSASTTTKPTTPTMTPSISPGEEPGEQADLVRRDLALAELRVAVVEHRSRRWSCRQSTGGAALLSRRACPEFLAARLSSLRACLACLRLAVGELGAAVLRQLGEFGAAVAGGLGEFGAAVAGRRRRTWRPGRVPRQFGELRRRGPGPSRPVSSPRLRAFLASFGARSRATSANSAPRSRRDVGKLRRRARGPRRPARSLAPVRRGRTRGHARRRRAARLCPTRSTNSLSISALPESDSAGRRTPARRPCVRRGGPASPATACPRCRPRR